MIERVKVIRDMILDLGNVDIELEGDYNEFDLLYNRLIYLDKDPPSLKLAYIADKLEVKEILDYIINNFKTYPISDLLINYKYYNPSLRSKIGIYLFLNNINEEWTRNEFMKEMKKRYPGVEIDPDANLEIFNKYSNKVTVYGNPGNISIIEIDRKLKVMRQSSSNEDYIFIKFHDKKIDYPVIYTISDEDLYYNLIYDLNPFKNQIPIISSYRLNTEMFNEIISKKGFILKKGDIVHIPLYDFEEYSSRIMKFLLIYDGIKLIYPFSNKIIRPGCEELSHLVRGIVVYPGPEFPFPEFSFEHFDIFRISRMNSYQIRFINKEFIKIFNDSNGLIFIDQKGYSFNYNGKLDPQKRYIVKYNIGFSDLDVIINPFNNNDYRKFSIEEI